MVTPRLILVFFLLAQVCDGLLTYVGVKTFGVIAEGNLLLFTWMLLVGPGPAIIGAKVLAAACGTLLYCLGIRRVLVGLTMFYTVAAIGPWIVLLQRI